MCGAIKKLVVIVALAASTDNMFVKCRMGILIEVTKYVCEFVY